MLRRLTAALIVLLVLSACAGSDGVQEPAASSSPAAVASPGPSDVPVATAELPVATAEPEPTAAPEPAAEPEPTEENDDGACFDPERQIGRLNADLDGDGVDEVLFRTETDQGTAIETCAPSLGAIDPIIVGSPNKPVSIQIVDMNQDGVDELLVGGPTGAAPYVGGLFILNDRTWRPSRETVTVRPALDEPGSQGESFTCADNNGDGGGELVAVSYRIVDDLMVWDAGADSGEFQLPDQWVHAWLLASGTCWNQVTLPVPSSNPVTAFVNTVGTTDVPTSAVAPGTVIGLGLHDQVLVERSATELSTAEGWILDETSYAQFDGPFSALDALANASEVELIVGTHDHCAGAPLQVPPGLEDTVQLAIQPAGKLSCIDWFSVNLFVDEQMNLRAVTLELFGP